MAVISFQAMHCVFQVMVVFDIEDIVLDFESASQVEADHCL